MKTTTNKLPQDILSGIEKTINKALIQRGFPVIVASQDETETRYPRVNIISEKFNTVPVIMEHIQVDNFGSSVCKTTKKIIREDDNKNNFIDEVEIISIWISVHISYSHFNGGTNGTELFSYYAEVAEWERDGEIELNLCNEAIRV